MITAAEYLQLRYDDVHFNVTEHFDALGCNPDDCEKVEDEIRDAIVEILADDQAPAELRDFAKKFSIGNFRVLVLFV